MQRPSRPAPPDPKKRKTEELTVTDVEEAVVTEQVAVEDDSSSSYDRDDYTYCIRVVTDLEMAPGKTRTYKQYFRPICCRQLADMIEDQARNMTQEELAKFRSLPLAEKLAFRVECTYDEVKTEFPDADARVKYWLAQVPLPEVEVEVAVKVAPAPTAAPPKK
jgi:hypothetical protein